ncbi:unnamed protein product [Absidia cylindrospora]
MITKPNEQQQQQQQLPSHHKSNNSTGISRPRKRTHLTTGQIASLQASFASNPLPDAAIRHGLSLSLGITERTVQIWFQNRRAKARKMEEGGAGGINGNGGKLNTPGGSSTAPLSASTQAPRYQATFRSMMTPQLFEEMKASNSSSITSSSLNPTALGIRRRPRSASKPEKPKPTPIALAPRAMSEEKDCLRQQESSSSSFSCLESAQTPAKSMTFINDQSNIVSLPVHLLRIGAWTRFANANNAAEWGLVCYCTKDQFIWQIQAEGQQFRIHIPLTAIHQLSFGPSATDDATAAQLDLQLDPQQLMFTMCLTTNNQQQEWVRCGDFSEDKQASRLFVHEIQGHHDVLQQALLTLLTAVPELAPKLVLMTSPLLDDLCRDFTMSPSATPEPSSFMMMNNIGSSLMYPNHPPTTANLDKSMILQPFYYSPSPLDDQHLYDQMMML